MKNMQEENCRRRLIVLDNLPVVSRNEDAALLDMGDGVACFQFRSKGNSITPTVKEFLLEVLERRLSGFDGLVIGNQSKNFSVGANLHVMKRNLERGDYEAFANNVIVFQQLNRKIKYYGKPIVAAPYRHTLGGGLEIAMHCHARVAPVQCHMGLVEIGVGLIPGGGGTKECARLAGTADDSMLRTVFEKLLLRTITKDAQQAKRLFYLRETDLVVPDIEGLLPAAKQQCLDLAAQGRRVPGEERIALAGRTAYRRMLDWSDQLLEAGTISAYDAEVGKRIATVLSGGDIEGGCELTEKQLLNLERENFLDLIHQKRTADRISYFVEHGRLLRN